VSNPDSFIDEVTEEVRRERFFGFLRRYAWAIGLALVAIVGGAGVLEWQKARARAAAEARGSAIHAALSAADAPARVAALEPLASAPDAVIERLALAGAQVADGKPDAAVATLQALAADPAAGPEVQAVAQLRAVMLQGSDMALADRLAALDGLVAPGSAFRALALEQRALAHLDNGDTAAALADLSELYRDAASADSTRGRAEQLIIALGGEVPALTADPASVETGVEAGSETGAGEAGAGEAGAGETGADGVASNG
jgi:hypothetical protein